MLALYWQTLRMKYMINAATGRGYTQVRRETSCGTFTNDESYKTNVIQVFHYFTRGVYIAVSDTTYGRDWLRVRNAQPRARCLSFELEYSRVSCVMHHSTLRMYCTGSILSKAVWIIIWREPKFGHATT